MMSAKVQDAGSDNGSGICFNDLPVEIISLIFEFIPYPHFLDIRFVCRLWYSVATQNHYSLDHERVVCVRDFGDPTTWTESSRDFHHLRFQGEDNTRVESSYWTDWPNFYDEKFWTRFGYKLRSLSFRMCQIDNEEFLKILSFCHQLRSLEIVDCKLSSRATGNNDSTSNSPKLFHLERLKISYGDLIKGRDHQPRRGTSHGYNDPNGKLFNAILSNAPNMKSLLLRNCMTDRKSGEEIYLTSEHLIDYMRTKSEQIIELCLKTDENVDKQTLVKLLSIANLQLRSLETNFPFPLALTDRLESLEYLDLDHHTDEQREIEAIFHQLQNLRCLKLRCETYSVSRIFLLHNLTFLDLDIDFIGYDSVALQLLIGDISLTFMSEVYPFYHADIFAQAVDSMLATAFCGQVNTKLKKLCLKCFCTPVSIMKLAKTHPALTHLSLNCHNAVSDWSVQAIFKFLVSLETLELATCGDISEAGITGQVIINDSLNLEENPTGYSLERLKNLSDLKLQYFRGTLFEDGLILPELRHLRLQRSLTSASSIKHLIKNHPRIETLDCKCNGLTDQLVEDIIRSLPRLRYFDAGDDYQISFDSREKLRCHCRTFVQ